MNTTETNKKLAEFLGWSKGTYQRKVTNPKHPEFKRKQPIKEVYLLEDSHPIVENIYTDLPGFYWDYDKEDENGNTVNRLNFFPENLKFHNDWNWLMLVIIKAKEGEAELNKEGSKLLYNIYEALTDVNINTTYNACSMFVDWYNNQKP